MTTTITDATITMPAPALFYTQPAKHLTVYRDKQNKQSYSQYST